MRLKFLQVFRFSEIRRDKWLMTMGKLSRQEISWLRVRRLVSFIYLTLKFIVLLPVSLLRSLFALVLILDEFERLHFSPLRKMRRGKDCVIDRQTWLVNGQNIYLGDFVKISAFSSVIAGNVSTVSIGSNTIVAPGVTIVSINHVYEQPEMPIRYQGFKDTKLDSIVIGEDVWLGAGVVVLPGTSIGAGSVIGAGVVVRGEVPPNTILYGKNIIASKER